MRNYANVWITGGSLDDGGGNTTAHSAVFGTKSEMQDYLDATPLFSPSFSQQCWILLNKSNVMALANEAYQAELVTPGTGILADTPPKKVWNGKDTRFVNLGIESATGYVSKLGGRIGNDLGGASALYNDFVSLLANLIARYKARKDARTVGILQFLQKQFFAGQLSITDILAQLSKLFIV